MDIDQVSEDAPVLGSAERTIRVLIADDDPIVQKALVSYVGSAGDLAVAGTVASGPDAIRTAVHEPVDVVLMDVQMPGMDGLTASREILKSRPEIKILILTSFNDRMFLRESLRCGAAGYLLKSTSPEALVEAVRSAARGVTVMSPTTAKLFAERSVEGRRAAPANPRPDKLSLTRREHAILRLLCTGASNSEIADDLHVSESTVKTNVSAVMTKLGVSSRLKVVVRAHEWRLLDEQCPRKR